MASYAQPRSLTNRSDSAGNASALTGDSSGRAGGRSTTRILHSGGEGGGLRTPISGPVAGFVFGCARHTEEECLTGGVFGLPQNCQQEVEVVWPGMPLFLFNFQTRVLHGVFEATTSAVWMLNSTAFAGARGSSPFPCQVGVTRLQSPPPLTENQIRPVLEANYYEFNRFRLGLTHRQVHGLLVLFEEAWARRGPGDSGGDRNREYRKRRAPEQLLPAGCASAGSGSGGGRDMPPTAHRAAVNSIAPARQAVKVAGESHAMLEEQGPGLVSSPSPGGSRNCAAASGDRDRAASGGRDGGRAPDAWLKQMGHQAAWLLRTEAPGQQEARRQQQVAAAAAAKTPLLKPRGTTSVVSPPDGANQPQPSVSKRRRIGEVGAPVVADAAATKSLRQLPPDVLTKLSQPLHVLTDQRLADVAARQPGSTAQPATIFPPPMLSPPVAAKGKANGKPSAAQGKETRKPADKAAIPAAAAARAAQQGTAAGSRKQVKWKPAACPLADLAAAQGLALPPPPRLVGTNRAVPVSPDAAAATSVCRLPPPHTTVVLGNLPKEAAASSILEAMSAWGVDTAGIDFVQGSTLRSGRRGLILNLASSEHVASLHAAVHGKLWKQLLPQAALEGPPAASKATVTYHEVQGRLWLQVDVHQKGVKGAKQFDCSLLEASHLRLPFGLPLFFKPAAPEPTPQMLLRMLEAAAQQPSSGRAKLPSGGQARQPSKGREKSSSDGQAKLSLGSAGFLTGSAAAESAAAEPAGGAHASGEVRQAAAVQLMDPASSGQQAKKQEAAKVGRKQEAAKQHERKQEAVEKGVTIGQQQQQQHLADAGQQQRIRQRALSEQQYSRQREAAAAGKSAPAKPVTAAAKQADDVPEEGDASHRGGAATLLPPASAVAAAQQQQQQQLQCEMTSSSRHGQAAVEGPAVAAKATSAAERARQSAGHHGALPFELPPHLQRSGSSEGAGAANASAASGDDSNHTSIPAPKQQQQQRQSNMNASACSTSIDLLLPPHLRRQQRQQHQEERDAPAAADDSSAAARGHSGSAREMAAGRGAQSRATSPAVPDCAQRSPSAAAKAAASARRLASATGTSMREAGSLSAETAAPAGLLPAAIASGLPHPTGQPEHDVAEHPSQQSSIRRSSDGADGAIVAPVVRSAAVPALLDSGARVPAGGGPNPPAHAMPAQQPCAPVAAASSAPESGHSEAAAPVAAASGPVAAAADKDAQAEQLEQDALTQQQQQQQQQEEVGGDESPFGDFIALPDSP